MEVLVGRVFAGHLRSIIGGLTVEQIIRERDRVAQEVIEQQTALAQRRADLAAQRLEAEVRRPADAEAYKQRTLAEANRSRADSLAGGNQELIAASRIVEALPSMVTAAAQGIAASNLTILNATEGVSQVVARHQPPHESRRGCHCVVTARGSASAPSPGSLPRNRDHFPATTWMVVRLGSAA
jgi:uncharacterized membrane protein YqiK